MPCIVCYQSMFCGADDGVDDGGGGQPAALGCGHAFHTTCIAQWFAQSNRTACPVCKQLHSGPMLRLFIDVSEDDVSDMPRAADPESPASDTDDECSRSELEDRITELESSLAAQTQLVEQRDAQAAAHAAAMAQRDQESCAAQAKARALQREVDTMARRLREAHPMARQRQAILPVEREDDTDLRAEVAALESVAQARRRRITELEKRLADLLLPFDR